MTHRLATNYAKNYCNRTLIVKVIVENVVTCFLGTRCSDIILVNPLDAHRYHMGTAIEHPHVPDRVKLSFVIFDIRALRRSGLSVRVPRCQKLQMTA